MSTIFTHFASTVNILQTEVLRYMGCKTAKISEELQSTINLCVQTLNQNTQYRACHTILPIIVQGNTVDFGCLQVNSRHLAKNLQGCSHAILFAATAGIYADRMRQTMAVKGAANELCADAVGTAAVEAWCDTLNEMWQKAYAQEGKMLRPRYSPGYGDTPLETQTDLVRILDTQRKIGVSLSSSILMNPTKSVTAFIGIAPSAPYAQEPRCAQCTQSDCNFMGGFAKNTQEKE